MEPIPGSYEALVTRRLLAALQALDGSWVHQIDELDAAEAADRLALHLSHVIEKVLAAMPAEQRVNAGTKLIGELIVQALQGKPSVLTGEVPDTTGRLANIWKLVELFALLAQRNQHLGCALTERLDVPLQVHARYSRFEIQAAFGDVATAQDEHAHVKVPAWREGVKFMQEERCDVFLITLNKTEKRFSPSTRYRDYAINRSLFHWESQSRTTADSPTGQRYQLHRSQGTEVMVFVRMNAEDRAFHFLGPASYQSHQSEMPMQITWRLKHQLPGDLFLTYRAAAA